MKKYTAKELITEGYKLDNALITNVSLSSGDLGVSRLEDMKGKYVRVATKKWGDTVKIIGNIIKDRWFDYQSFYADKKEESK